MPTIFSMTARAGACMSPAAKARSGPFNKETPTITSRCRKFRQLPALVRRYLFRNSIAFISRGSPSRQPKGRVACLRSTTMRIAPAWGILLGLFIVILSPSPGLGYRPFVSTDAAVADVKEVEIEFGYFNLERDRGRNTFIVPKAVLNYGLIRNLEVVGEFAVEEP